MKIKRFVLLVAAMSMAIAVWAGEETDHHMLIDLVEADGDHNIHVEIDSDDLDFDLHEMQVGENRSIIDKDGRSILVTRTEDGYTFNVDGKTIEMPAFDGIHDADVRVIKTGIASDVDVHVSRDQAVRVHKVAPRVVSEENGVMIISGKEIDAATQQAIRSALQSAGHNDVQFLGGHDGGPHQVKVVRKVEVIN